MPRSGNNDFEKWTDGPVDAERRRRRAAIKTGGPHDSGCLPYAVVILIIITVTVITVLAILKAG